MGESWKTWWKRHLFNLIPAYRGTGAKITYIAHDWKNVKIKLPLKLKTRNYIGTLFGGSMYAACDPIYMIMLIKILGLQYIVWDKSAHIQFLRPGTSTLYAKFSISDEEIKQIKKQLEKEKSITRNYSIELKDSKQETKAKIDKEIYIRKKN